MVSWRLHQMWGQMVCSFYSPEIDRAIILSPIRINAIDVADALAFQKK